MGLEIFSKFLVVIGVLFSLSAEAQSLPRGGWELTDFTFKFEGLGLTSWEGQDLVCSTESLESAIQHEGSFGGPGKAPRSLTPDWHPFRSRLAFAFAPGACENMKVEFVNREGEASAFTFNYFAVTNFDQEALEGIAVVNTFTAQTNSTTGNYRTSSASIDFFIKEDGDTANLAERLQVPFSCDLNEVRAGKFGQELLKKVGIWMGELQLDCYLGEEGENGFFQLIR